MTAISFISIFTLFVIFVLTSVLPTKWLKVEHVYPINKDHSINKKILQISDIHIERNRISDKRIADLIKKESPDYICLTGDFMDFDASIPLLKPMLSVIQKSGIPSFAVLGNHDYTMRNPALLKNLLQDYGIYMLENTYIDLPSFTLVGIDDFCSGHHDLSIWDQLQKTEKPLIVMTHDPTVALYIPSFTYLFAGHFHGKQFAVPFLFWFKDFGPLAKSGIYKGSHALQNGNIYISKGIGQSGLNLRFLIRSEVTIHYM